MTGDLFTVFELSKFYGSRVAVSDLNLSAQPGEFIGLIGANGSGKTTFLRCLSGQLRSTSGRVVIDGVEMLRDPVQAKGRIGYAIEPELLPQGLTGFQILEFVAGTKRRPDWRREIAVVAEMLEIDNRLGERVQTYSHGMRTKIGILAALIGEPKLLILDESLSALDPVSAYRLKKHLTDGAADKRWTVILSTHMIEAVEQIATRVVMLHGGTLAADWKRNDLEKLKSDSGQTLEEILVERITSGR